MLDAQSLKLSKRCNTVRAMLSFVLFMDYQLLIGIGQPQGIAPTGLYIIGIGQPQGIAPRSVKLFL